MNVRNPGNNVRANPIVERHIQTLLLAIVVGLLAWSGNTTLRLIETTARQDERISTLITLTESLRRDLRETGDEFMTISEAQLNRDQMRGRIDSIDSRVSRLEDQ